MKYTAYDYCNTKVILFYVQVQNYYILPISTKPSMGSVFSCCQSDWHVPRFPELISRNIMIAWRFIISSNYLHAASTVFKTVISLGRRTRSYTRVQALCGVDDKDRRTAHNIQSVATAPRIRVYTHAQTSCFDTNPTAGALRSAQLNFRTKPFDIFA